jgi:hypothetical protein
MRYSEGSVRWTRTGPAQRAVPTIQLPNQRQVRRLEAVDARKKRFAAVVALILIVATFIAWLSLRRAEPVYNGKALTFWAQQYGSNNWSGRKELAREAEFAVRQIGPGAIPFLLHLMEARDSDLKKSLRRHLPRKWHEPLHLNDDSGRVRRIGAHGLAALGTNAPTAVPALIKLAMQHPDEDGRYIAVFALRTLGPAAEPAIPFYLQCLTNKDNTIRNEAAVGLALIPESARDDLACLIEVSGINRDLTRMELYSAIALLGRFGTNAQSAVPRLLSLLKTMLIQMFVKRSPILCSGLIRMPPRRRRFHRR